MSNHERGRKMLAAAAELLIDLEAALKRESWNIAVRRAQEVVELVLKGTLAFLGADYPKVHDVADVFLQALERKGMALESVAATDVRQVSARLARDRSPAFYFEQDEERESARAAAADAQRLHALCARLVAAIDGSGES